MRKTSNHSQKSRRNSASRNQSSHARRSVTGKGPQKSSKNTRPSRQEHKNTSNINQKRQKKQGGRISLLFITTALLFFAVLLVLQLYQLQIIDHEVNAQKAASQHFVKVTEQPERGRIYDRNGIELAGTTYVYRIGITPRDVRSITKDIKKAEIAKAISQALHLAEKEVLQKLNAEDETYLQLKKDVPKSEADALREYLNENNIGGIRIDAEPRRYYTNGSLASQLLGFANYDNGNLQGQLGIELQYNDLLTGQPGYTYVETDNYGNRGNLPFSVPTSLGAKNGNDLHLYMDINIQKIVQEELERAIIQYDITAGGSAIVLDPYTGGVLAMASYPFFDNSEPTLLPEDFRLDTYEGFAEQGLESDSEQLIEFLSAQVWRNRAISDTYEPGSTMKAITTAISFEENQSQESEMFDDSPMQVLDWTISCATRSGHGIESLEQGFWRSCNPVFAQLAQRTGVTSYYKYMAAFGFMDVTGIDLPAEGIGILHEDPTVLDMVTLSYGESSTLTPLQMASAFSTFANGGNLIRPTVLKTVTDSEGAIISETKPETIRKVISDQTSVRVRELLKGVVLYGTGSQAYVEGYSVAGKTSTSTDDFGDHTISFAALAPADSPEIVLLVVLQKPRDQELSSGGAAKTAGMIIDRTLEYLGVRREYSETDIERLSETSLVPDVTGMTYQEAMKALNEADLRAEAGLRSMSDQTIVKSQYPQMGTEVHQRSLIYLYPSDQVPSDLVVVPDLTGKTVHESILSANEAGLNIYFDGDCLGIVESQKPGALYTQEMEDDDLKLEQEQAPGFDHDEGNQGQISDEDPQTIPKDLGSNLEIDPITGNPLKQSKSRLQRGSQIILTFITQDEAFFDEERIEELDEDKETSTEIVETGE